MVSRNLFLVWLMMVFSGVVFTIAFCLAIQGQAWLWWLVIPTFFLTPYIWGVGRYEKFAFGLSNYTKAIFGWTIMLLVAAFFAFCFYMGFRGS